MLRRVVIEHDSQTHNGTIRNISSTGALIEGAFDVPAGTPFTVRLSDTRTICVTARWCDGERMGVEFDQPLDADPADGLPALRSGAPAPVLRPRFRRTG